MLFFRSNGRHGYPYVKNKSMFPFNNTLMNQYMSDMYQSVNNSMPGNFFSVPEDSVAFWDPIKNSDGPQENPYFQSPFQQEVKKEPPTEPSLKPTKPKPSKPQEPEIQNWSGEESNEKYQINLKQKYGRNINSNIFHHMVKTIKTDDRFRQILLTLINKYQPSLTEKEFWQLLHRKTHKLRIYISLKKMGQYWSAQLSHKRFSPDKRAKEDDFALLFRTLCCYYLRNVHLTYVFNVLKLQPESKKLHVKGVSQMLDVFKHHA